MDSLIPIRDLRLAEVFRDDWITGDDPVNGKQESEFFALRACPHVFQEGHSSTLKMAEKVPLRSVLVVEDIVPLFGEGHD